MQWALGRAVRKRLVIPPLRAQAASDRALSGLQFQGSNWSMRLLGDAVEHFGEVIGTCKLNAVEPYAWLKTTLEKIAAGHPQSRLHELLPWACSATSN